MGYFIKAEPNVKVYVEDVNPSAKQTIVFLHGWPANHKLFEYQFTVLPAFGYRCIGLDMRGFGQSDKPWGSYSYNRLADDVRSVMAALELQNVTLAAHSIGGAIAIRYMARHNGYAVSKLILMGAAAPSFIKQPHFPYGLSREEVTKIIQQTYENRPEMLRNLTNLFFFKQITPPFSEWFFQMGLDASGYATAKAATSLRDEVLFQDAETIKVPTLILHGIHDQICPFPLAGALHESIPLSKLVPFEYSGHGLFWEEKEKLNQEIIAFLE